MFVFVLILLLIVGLGIFYAFKIEPYRISLQTVNLTEQRENAQHVRIVQLSDIHIKEDFPVQELRKVVKLANEQAADIVLFTGDLYDNYAKYNEDETLIEALGALRAKQAKIAVWGNRDYGGGAARHYEDVMEAAGFTVLENENELVNTAAGAILFTGLDDALLGVPDPPSIAQFADAAYKILLTHEPDTVRKFLDLPYDIALAGHSHGGQFNIPFLPFINEKALEMTDLASIYSNGMYELGTTGIKRIFVNTGIGTTHISARFGVRPTLTLFNIYLD